MKKLFYSIVFLIGSFFVFSSCEKEGVTEDSALVGTWYCVKQTVTLDNGHTVSYTDKEEYLDVDNYLIMSYAIRFTSDGYYDAIPSYQDDFGIPDEYKVREGIIYELGVPLCEIVSNRGGELVLQMTGGFFVLDLANVLFEDTYGHTVTKVVSVYRKQGS